MRQTERKVAYPSCDKQGNITKVDYIEIKDKKLAEEKLCKLEDIEEELGIDLATFIKIFENGIYVKSQCTNNKIERWLPFDIKVIKSTYQTDICYIRSKKNKYVGCFNYGKTFALTKEELENEQKRKI